MSSEELGKALAEARIARGLTLHDVERDTRISSRYIQALEEGKLDVLPAPVYARAFMRTYSQYLGLNSATFVQRMPGARPEPELPPLPAMGREAATPLISASWLVVGGVVVLLLLFGLLLFWNRGGGGGESVSGVPSAVPGQGAEQPTEAAPPDVQVQPGVVPNLVRQDLDKALAALAEADLTYLVVEVSRGGVPATTVFQQSPSPGTPADDSTVVTLTVSR